MLTTVVRAFFRFNMVDKLSMNANIRMIWLNGVQPHTTSIEIENVEDALYAQVSFVLIFELQFVSNRTFDSQQL